MKKLSELEVKERMSKFGYLLLEPYVNVSTKSNIQCPEGHVTNFLLSNFFNIKTRCKICSKNRQAILQKIPYEKLLEEAAKSDLKITISKEEYQKNHKKKLVITCTCACGQKRNLSWNDIKQYKHCVKCKVSCEKLRRSKEHIIATCLSHGYKLEDVNFQYKSNKQKIKLICDKHGVFESRFNDIDQGHGCPNCGHINSNLEQELKDFVKSIYFGPILFNNRKVLKGLELDIWMPELKVGIEFDGLYWHSESRPQNQKSKNLRKIKEIQQQNIKFLAVFEDEWKDLKKKEIVKSMIRSRLGLSSEAVYARNTVFENTDKKEAKQFMEDNHLDGHVQCKESLGLRDLSGRLVMCVTLRTSMRGEREIARMASLINTKVVGGASKIISHITGNLVSYSNNRMSNGNVYDKIGFKEETLTKSLSYYYTDFKKRVWRFKCRKLKDISLGLTEKEQAKNGAFEEHFGHSRPVYRIYDYGHRRWIRN